MKLWWVAAASVVALVVVIGSPFLVWLALTSLDMGRPPYPPDRFDHGTFSTFGIAMLQAMLTMTVIIIAVMGFMGYQAIKTAAEEKAGSVATERVDEELKRWAGSRSSSPRPSSSAPPPAGDDPTSRPTVALEIEDEGNAPS